MRTKQISRQPLGDRGREAGMTQQTNNNTNKERTTTVSNKANSTSNATSTTATAPAPKAKAKTRALDIKKTAPAAPATKVDAKATPKTAPKGKAVGKVTVGTKVSITASMAPDAIKKTMRKVHVGKELGDSRKAGFSAKSPQGELSLHKSEVKKGEWTVKLDGKPVVESTRYFKARRLLKAMLFGVVKANSPEAAAIVK